MATSDVRVFLLASLRFIDDPGALIKIIIAKDEVEAAKLAGGELGDANEDGYEVRYYRHLFTRPSPEIEDRYRYDDNPDDVYLIYWIDENDEVLIAPDEEYTCFFFAYIACCCFSGYSYRSCQNS